MSAYPGISLAANGTSPPLPIIFRPLTHVARPAMLFAGFDLDVLRGRCADRTVQVTADQVPSDDGNWNNHDILVSITSQREQQYRLSGDRHSSRRDELRSGSVNLGVARWP